MQPIVHVGRSLNGSGGVESLLALHLKHRPNETVITFNDKISLHSNHHPLNVELTDTVDSIKRKFADIVPHGAVIIYHNAYFLSFLGEVDKAICRVIYWHSWDVPGIHLWRTENLITSNFLVSSSLSRLVSPSPASVSRIFELPLPARVNAAQTVAPEWNPADVTSTRFAYIGRLEKHCKRVDRIPLLAEISSAIIGTSSIELFGKGALGGTLEGNYGKCVIKERGWFDRDALEKELMSMCGTIVVSDQEGFGLMAVDSLAIGLPVVFPRIESDVVALLESIDERLLYPPGDLHGLAERMKWLATSSVESLAELSHKSRESVRSRTLQEYFEKWDESIEATLSLCELSPIGNGRASASIPGFLPVMLYKALARYLK